MKPKVAVVIVVWNGVEDTLECLNSLAKDSYKNKEIIVVDNASTDGTSEILRSSNFNVKIVHSSANLGFTGGNNLGLAEAQKGGAHYAFLLNNDTTVEPGALSALVDTAEQQPSSGILSPVIHYHDIPAEIWFAGASLKLRVGEALHDHSFQPGRLTPPYASPWVSGCAMLVRITALQQVGAFDERFYLNWEDVDWCVRMHNAAWKVMVVPRARIYHKGGRSQSRLDGVKSYYTVRNSLLLCLKHAKAAYMFSIFAVMGRQLHEALRHRGPERLAIWRTACEGLRDHLLGRYGPRGIRQTQIGVRSRERPTAVSV